MKKYSPKGSSTKPTNGGTNKNRQITAKPSGEAQARKPFPSLPKTGVHVIGTDTSRHITAKPTGNSGPIGSAQPLKNAGAIKKPMGSDNPLGPNRHKTQKPTN